jgi:hypothetical protein
LGLLDLVVLVELIDAFLDPLRLFPMLIDNRGLRFAEADEVDEVGEYLNEAFARRLVEVLESEVVDAALEKLISPRSLLK